MKNGIHIAKPRERGKSLRHRAGRIGMLLACALLHLCAPAETAAQESGGSTAAAMAGGAFGLSAGATLGAVGSIIPCSQSRPGPTCVRWSAVGGGALGLVGGALLGAADSDRLGDAAVGAGIGFLVGAAGGLVLKSASERFGWQDVAAVGLFGGAIGSAPLGSAAGFLGGSAVGFVLWGLIDDFETPDLLGAAIAGLALGGITEWLVRGIDAQSSGGPELQLSLSMRPGF